MTVVYLALIAGIAAGCWQLAMRTAPEPTDALDELRREQVVRFNRDADGAA